MVLHFSLVVDDIGTDRVKAMKTLRETFGVSVNEAKQLISAESPTVKVGPMRYLLRFRDELSKGGVQASIVYNAAGDDRLWIPDELSVDKRHCSKCGAELFVVLPGLTTPEDVREFARSHEFRGAKECERTGWLHPGAYCPNRCGVFLLNLE